MPETVLQARSPIQAIRPLQNTLAPIKVITAVKDIQVMPEPEDVTVQSVAKTNTTTIQENETDDDCENYQKLDDSYDSVIFNFIFFKLPKNVDFIFYFQADFQEHDVCEYLNEVSQVDSGHQIHNNESNILSIPSSSQPEGHDLEPQKTDHELLMVILCIFFSN